jgi:hypothetical protein
MAPKKEAAPDDKLVSDKEFESIINGLYKAVDLAPVNLQRGTYVENTIPTVAGRAASGPLHSEKKPAVSLR